MQRGTIVIEFWAALGLWTGVARSGALYALVSALHIVGLGLLFGTIVAVDLRLLGRLRALDAHAVATLQTVAKAGLALALVTGVLLASTRPAEYIQNRVFLAKLALIAFAILHALIAERHLRADSVASVLDTRSATQIGVTSLTLWVAVIALGRWIAFV